MPKRSLPQGQGRRHLLRRLRSAIPHTGTRSVGRPEPVDSTVTPSPDAPVDHGLPDAQVTAPVEQDKHA